MLPPLYRRLEHLPEPVEAFEAKIPTGVSPFAVIGFKASLIREGSARVEGNFKSFAVEAGDLVPELTAFWWFRLFWLWEWLVYAGVVGRVGH